MWRPTGTEACYELVGYNIPLDDVREEERNISDSDIVIEAEGFLSPPGDNEDPLHSCTCVVMPARESKQIEFMAGDVVGYYVDHFLSDRNRSSGGIQWIEDHEVEIHFRDRLPREDVKWQYGSSCGFQVSETIDLHTLDTTSSYAPILSVSIGKPS